MYYNIFLRKFSKKRALKIYISSLPDRRQNSQIFAKQEEKNVNKAVSLGSINVKTLLFTFVDEMKIIKGNFNHFGSHF